MATQPLLDDELTSLMMAQLDLDDIEELRMFTADETTPDEEGLTNEELALRVQARYIQNMYQVMEDRMFALTFDQGLEANYPGFQNINTTPHSPRTNPPSPQLVLPQHDDGDDDGLGYVLNLAALPSPLSSPAISGPGLVLTDDDDDLTTSEMREHMPEFIDALPYDISSLPDFSNCVKQIQCTICKDQFTEDSALHAPCDHDYCGDCIVNFVTTCTRDESVFPPKCCDQRIPSNSLGPFLSPDTQSLYNSKCREFAVHVSDRVYCPTPNCSAFLGSSASSHTKGEAYCNRCDSRVCVMCKQPAHSGDRCTEDTVTQEVRALARTEGWQTCPDCSAIIELDHGCFHMICIICRAQFCYICAVRWKQCTCPQWDEAHL